MSEQKRLSQAQWLAIAMVLACATCISTVIVAILAG